MREVDKAIITQREIAYYRYILLYYRFRFQQSVQYQSLNTKCNYININIVDKKTRLKLRFNFLNQEIRF